MSPLPANYASSRGVMAPKGNLILPSALIHQTFTNPAAASTNAFKLTGAAPNTTTVIYRSTLSSVAGATAFGGALATGVPDMPRNVVITVTHASAVVALSGVISGYDAYGRNITEAWSVTAGTTSKTFTGAKAFARVDNVTVVAAADASADSIVIGTGSVLGFAAICSCASAVKEIAAGALVTTGTLVVGSHSSAAADYIGTYLPSTIPDGTKTYEVWYISDQPEST